MKTQSATVGFNNTVHIGVVESDGTMRRVLCGAEFTRSQYQRMAVINPTKHDVTCKRCMKRKQNMEAK